MRIVAGGLLVLAICAASARAQDDTLHILSHAPGEPASPGDAVTIVFDRPVAGRLDQTIPASQVIRITPAVQGRAYWRDPVTVVFVPDQPFAPGSAYTAVVDTNVRAVDGTSLAHPDSFSFRVAGPRLLGSSFQYDRVPDSVMLSPEGRFSLFYSAPVDLERFGKGMSLTLFNCPGPGVTEVPLVAVRQRPLGEKDVWWYRYYEDGPRDSVALRFMRIVEIVPTTKPPEDCRGQLAIPNTQEDARYGAVERHIVHTAPSFRLRPFECSEKGMCSADRIRIRFTAPVTPEEIGRHVHLAPAGAIDSLDRRAVGQSSMDMVFVAHLRPRTTYTVTVDSALRDAFGRSLEGPRNATLVTGDYVPQIAYPRGPLTAARSGPRTIPMRAINVRSVKIWALHVRPDRRMHAFQLATLWWAQSAFDSMADRIDSTRVVLHGRFNEEAAIDLPIPIPPAGRDDGLFAVRVAIDSVIASPEGVAARMPVDSMTGRDARNQYALLQWTDLAVTPSLSHAGGSVIVTGLADGRPRAGVRLRRVDRDGNVLAEGISDSLGLAPMQPSPLAPAAAAAPSGNLALDWSAGLIEARLGDDAALTWLTPSMIGFYRDQLSPSLLGGSGGESVAAAAGAIFADRGIYRPGQMLYLTGIVREGPLGALTTPSGLPVRITLSASREWGWGNDVSVHDTVLTTDAFGAVTDSLLLRAGSPLGSYEVELQVTRSGAWETVAQGSFRVAEYRAPQFLVDAHADSIPLYGGDTMHVAVAARYLFGAPMSRAPVQWQATLHELAPWEVHVPGAEGWMLGEWGWWNYSASDAEAEKSSFGADSLDAKGRAVIRVPIAGLHPERPGRLEVRAAVADLDRQAVAATAAVTVHPAHLYVLARRSGEDWYWTAGRPSSVEIKTVRPDGANLPGVSTTIELVRSTWDGRWSDSVLRTDTLRTAAAPVKYVLTPPAPGIYKLVMSAPDGRGATARTVFSGYALAAGGGWWDENPYLLRLVASERDVRVGDDLRVAFDSPFDSADAWISVEREGVIERRRVSADPGANVLTVHVRAEFIPNAFVSVLLLRKGAPILRPDSAAQLMRLGYVEMRVSTKSRRLEVAVIPAAATYHPRDTARVTLRVRDDSGRGAASEVTLWAVDEGVLALTDYRAPDVLSQMYEPRALGTRYWSDINTVLTTDPGRLVELLRARPMMLGEVVVTGAGTRAFSLPDAGLRSRFRSTAFYLARARTDSQGVARLSAEMPDNLTTYRVIAVAIGADARFGTGEASLLVTRELVIRPALPRFVRPGDSLLAGGVVNARDGREHAVTVTAAATGMSIEGAASRAVRLPAGRGAEVRFHFLAPRRDETPDSVVVRLAASDRAYRDAVETWLPVRPDFHPRSHAVIGAVRDSAVIVIDLPADVDARRSTIRVTAGVSPLTPILAGYEWLRSYPYDCSEQIASVGSALLAVWSAAQGDTTLVPGGDPRARLQLLADRLASRQRADGGIGYWDDHDWTSPWLTAYGGLFLLDARAHGITVDSTVLKDMVRYLSNELSGRVRLAGANRESRRIFVIALGERVAAVDFLRRDGAADTLVENELMREGSDLSWEDRLRLAEVLSARPSARAWARQVVERALAETRQAGTRVELPESWYAARPFASRIAPAARLLTASLAVHVDAPMLGGLVQTVLQQAQADGKWAWSTQDYAAAVRALALLRESEQPKRTAQFTAAGKTLFSGIAGTADSGVAVSLDGLVEAAAGGRGQLRVRISASPSTQPLYYAITLVEVPARPPVRPDFSGVKVERWYERFSDGKPVTAVTAGELVRVRLRVTVPAERDFVALEDPLPAGLEPVDLTLRTSTTLSPVAPPETESERYQREEGMLEGGWRAYYGVWSGGWWSPWDHTSQYDDRVVYFARKLWRGTYEATYVARATTSGAFAKPPAHAEEMYNPALEGRSDGGRFEVSVKPVP